MIINKLASIGVFKLRLSGGEPVMNPDISKLTDYAASSGLFVLSDSPPEANDSARRDSLMREIFSAENILNSSAMEIWNKWQA